MVIKINYTSSDVYVSTSVSPVYVVVNYSGTTTGAAVWGQITGTLSNQTDLQNALNAKFDDPTGTTAQYLRGDGSLATFPTIPSGTVTSVGLTMPSAFSVANSPITSSGTLAVTAAGTSAQYIRGDGQLANFPTNGGGGSSVNYYLNGSVTQGTFGGDTYYEMSKTPVIGAGTDFTRTNAQGNGYIASFITDAGDPSLLSIPGGNWNLEFYFNASSSGSTPQFYGEIYKVDASNNFTLIASASANPETISSGTIVDQYFTSIPVPQTSLLSTDRLAVRIYVIPSGRTITLHTENSNLCEVLTTFSTGLNALNGLTSQVQYFATGTSGTDFAISSVTDTHTFNLPTASATNRGALSSADWSTFNGKVGGSGVTGQVAYWNGTNSQTGSNNLFWDAANARLGIGTNTPSELLSILGATASGAGISLQNADGLGGKIIADNSRLYFYSNNSTLIYSITNSKIRINDGNGASIGFELGSGGSISQNGNGGGLTFVDTKAYLNNGLVISASNLLVGTTTDGGQRLQVQGDAFIKGSGNTSATTALLIQNSTPSDLFKILNNGVTSFGVNITSGNKFIVGPENTYGTFVISSSSSGVSIYGDPSGGWFTGYRFRGSAGTLRGGLFVNGTTDSVNYYTLGPSLTNGLTVNDTTGNISIGSTTDGGFKLDVNGTVRVSGNLTVDTNTLFVDASNDRVGIGTASPVSLLNLNNGDAWINVISQLRGLQFGFAGPTHGSYRAAVMGGPESYGSTDSGMLTFHTQNGYVISATPPERMRITSGGNLLVGTTTDNGSRFQVSGAATFSSDVSISGVLRETLTTNRQTASYTLALTDNGKLVEMNVATANNLTVPLNSSVAFPIGTKIDIAQYGAGQTTVVATSGVTVRSAGGALKLAVQYSGATLVKIGTDEWYLFGDITV